MVQDLIRLALHHADNVVETLNNRVHPFHAKCIQHGKLVNHIEHVDDLLDSLTKCVEFTKDVHLREIELLLVGRFLEFFLVRKFS